MLATAVSLSGQSLVTTFFLSLPFSFSLSNCPSRPAPPDPAGSRAAVGEAAPAHQVRNGDPRRPMGCQPCPRTRWGADAPGAPLENGTWAWEQRGRQLELELLGGRRRQTAGDLDGRSNGVQGGHGGREGSWGGNWAWGGRPREGRAPGARRALSPNPPTQRSAAAGSTRT